VIAFHQPRARNRGAIGDRKAHGGIVDFPTIADQRGLQRLGREQDDDWRFVEIALLLGRAAQQKAMPAIVIGLARPNRQTDVIRSLAA